DTFGVEADIVLSISFDCDGSSDSLPDSRIDMTSLMFEEGGSCTVTADLEEATCIMKFKNRQDLKVDILSLSTIDDPDGETLTPYDGIGISTTIPSKAIQKVDELFYGSDDSVEMATTTYQDDFTEDAEGYIETEGYLWIRQGDEHGEIGGLNSDFTTNRNSGATALDIWTNTYVQYADPNIYFAGLYSVDLEIAAVLDNATLDGGGAGDKFDRVQVDLIARQTVPGPSSSETIFQSWDFNSGPYDNTFSENLVCDLTAAWQIAFLESSLPDADTEGNSYSFYFHVTVSGTYSKINPMANMGFSFSTTITDRSESYVRWYVMTRFPESISKTSRINESISRVAEIITGDCLRMYSSCFTRNDAQPEPAELPEDDPDYVFPTNGCNSTYVIMNGLMLRHIPDAKCFVSFRELYDSLNAIFCLGMGIEDDPYRPGYQRIRIEEADFFYEDTPMSYGINYPDKIKRSIKSDQFYTDLTIGYQKWEAEAFSSLDEFITRRQYTTSLTQIGGNKSLLSSIIASPYAIEITRQQKLTTKDYKYDNDLFIIDPNSDDSLEGGSDVIDYVSYYNVLLSPLRNATRWFKWLFSIFKNHLDADSKLIFCSGEGNYDAVLVYPFNTCDPVDGVVAVETTEDMDLTYPIKFDYENNPPKVGFEQWDFTYPMSFENFQEVRNNFYQQLPVQWDDSGVKYGYVMEMAYKPAQGLATFKVLRAWEDSATHYLLLEDGTYILQEDGGYIIWEP
ncbi:MAG TPA: hypothetical protein PKW36_00810, partial [bacterium]|nr:hypothetical protein [bacterium]